MPKKPFSGEDGNGAYGNSNLKQSDAKRQFAVFDKPDA